LFWEVGQNQRVTSRVAETRSPGGSRPHRSPGPRQQGQEGTRGAAPAPPDTPPHPAPASLSPPNTFCFLSLFPQFLGSHHVCSVLCPSVGWAPTGGLPPRGQAPCPQHGHCQGPQPAPLLVRQGLNPGNGSAPRRLSPAPPARPVAPTHPAAGGRGVPHVVALLEAGARVSFCHLLLDTSLLRLHATHPAAKAGEVKPLRQG